jgi:hypothetical protein
MTRRISPGEYDVIASVIYRVDEIARQMEAKWGMGRLPALVPIDLATRFRAQARKFNQATQAYECYEIQKHGEAMERAWKALDAAATSAGAEPLPNTVWEARGPDGSVVLIGKTADEARTAAFGRKHTAWSLDEIAKAMTAFPELLKAKHAFPGAEVMSFRRDPYDPTDPLDDPLDDIFRSEAA